MMNRFDRDRNGVIERATGEWNNNNFDANAADVNRDGRITLDELRVYTGNQLRGGKSGGKIFTSFTTTYELMPEGIPPWFTDRDKDNDGQLTLFEYANGQPFTEAVISEFEWLDLNNDGIATLAECYVAIKTKEDEERKRLEEEGRAPNNNSPRANPRDRRDVNNTAGGSFTPSADQNSGGGRNNPTRPTPPNNANQRGTPQQPQPVRPAGGSGGSGGGRR
jgi:Ca2+-binding EF-hand superfamily protein